jgi:putative phosphotransacetylase
MDRTCIQRAVTLSVCSVLAKQGEYFVPFASSARHLHISRKDLDILFGNGYKLTVFKMLSQPGQFASNEKVVIKGPKSEMKNVRILGPERTETQVELSITDSISLGIEPVLKMSGDIADTPGAILVGPEGQVELHRGVIIAARHIHISEEQAALYHLKNGDVISLKKSGAREMIFGNIAIRCGSEHSLELHLDTDETNAALLENGDMLELLR